MSGWWTGMTGTDWFLVIAFVVIVTVPIVQWAVDKVAVIEESRRKKWRRLRGFEIKPKS